MVGHAVGVVVGVSMSTMMLPPSSLVVVTFRESVLFFHWYSLSRDGFSTSHSVPLNQGVH